MTTHEPLERELYEWARLRDGIPGRVRRGAWYPVLSAGADVTVVRAGRTRLSLPSSYLEVRATRPRAWSVVPRWLEAVLPPESWGTWYAVCPNCSERVPITQVSGQMPCSRCEGVFAIDASEYGVGSAIPERTSGAVPGTTPWSVLVVDDNAAIRDAIARGARRHGGIATTAPDAAAGLAAIQRDDFDVVITNLQMPGGGGLWLWRHAMEVRPELRGRFVLISSERRPEASDMNLFLESEHFVIKPFALEGLWHQVSAALQAGSSTMPDHSMQDQGCH